MVSKLRIVFLIILAIIFSVPCALSKDCHPGIQRIKERGKLIIAMLNEDHPPFFMVSKKGELYGLDVKLGTDIANQLGVEVEFTRKAKSFDEVIAMVIRKEADVAISKLSKTLERSEKVLFTDPYIILRQGLLVDRLKIARIKEDEDPIEFITHLRGDIGVIASSSYVEFAQRMFPKATIKEFGTWEDVIAALEKGDILAAFRDELEIKKIIRAKPHISLDVQTVIFKDTKDPIAMAVSRDNTLFLYWLNEYLEVRDFNLDADKLLSEYSGIFSSGNR
jgi:polar amino acid transport system substrate-binding protein